MIGLRDACTWLAATSVAVAACGCSEEGSIASPQWQGEAIADATVGVNYTVCADGVQPTFDSLLTKVFSTGSCGTNRINACHSTSGARTTGNELDFTLDASSVYGELVGPDGSLIPSKNINVCPIQGPCPSDPARVVPGDADASMLYVKLTLSACGPDAGGSDPRYGCGMPLTNPASVCPPVLDAVRSWINSGAPEFSDGGAD
jgi:hypothetical protein